MDDQMKIKILYDQLRVIEEKIGLLDGQKLELMGKMSDILDELEDLGENVDI